MKTIVQFIAAIMLVTLSVDMQAQNNKKFKTTTFECSIDCHSCKKKIMTHIPYERGIKDVDVDVEKKTVTVKYKRNKNSDAELIKAFEGIGFKAVVRKEDTDEKKKKEQGEEKK